MITFSVHRQQCLIGQNANAGCVKMMAVTLFRTYV